MQIQGVNSLLTDDGAAECLGGVAAGAVGAEAAVMHILSLVAGVAIGGQFGAGDVFRLMASIATDTCMGAGEGIARVAAMIKAYAFPSQRAVAVAAGLRKTAFVHIVFAMAGRTGGWRTLVGAGFVATFAGDQNVKASERVTR